MTTHSTQRDGARDFDFLFGHWHIANRRLVRRLQGCTEWESFDAASTAHPLPGGIGNFDEFNPGSWRAGFIGMSLRIFNPATQLWSIYWLENQTGGLDASGCLQAPVVGRFVDGIGIFECDDMLDGRKIRVRYTWSNITADSARWEQAMSDDSGQSWECNWVMEMSRRSQGKQ